MSSNNNNDELLKLPNDLVRKTLINLIKNRLNITDAYELNIENGSTKGDNYVGIIYRAKITLLNETIENNNHLRNTRNIMIKVPPQNEIRREQFFVRPCFLRESLVYDKILPMLKEFQLSNGIIPEKNGFHEYAECYQTLTENKCEAIFLKDLSMDGFSMYNRLDDITADHVKLVMIILGKYHALSFAIKDQCPEKLIEYKNLPDILLQRENDAMLLQYFDALKVRAFNTLCPNNDMKYIQRYNQLFAKTNFMALLKDLLNGDLAEPYTILCHGDCWNNNILFKSVNGKPIDARLIDWQILRYASPVCDLMYYIFSCTTKELRDQYYDEFLNIYFQTLTDTIQKLGSNPDKLFQRHEFNEQLKKFGSFGLLMGMMLLPFFTSSVEDIPDLDELSEQLQSGDLNIDISIKSKTSIDVYKKRMRDIIIDMVNYDYI